MIQICLQGHHPASTYENLEFTQKGCHQNTQEKDIIWNFPKKLKPVAL